MSCPSETRLQAFVDGDLAPDELGDMSAHLDTCEDCRTLIGAVQPVALDENTTADRIGRYVLRRVLGKGGMGVVYEAVDPELHRVVALKVLRSDLGGRQDRLLAEARAMAKLSHPNVVAIHDVGRDGERVFIVMALVVGMPLRHWLAQEPRSAATIVEVFEQAGEGLRAAHEAGLVHRDFKPENVFVAADGRVLVGDFGLAIAHDTETKESAGSLAYMAPEQRRGQKVDARADQYSFCLSLGEAIATAATAPRWVAPIVSRGTKADPSDRFSSMADLLAAIRKKRGRARARPIVLAVVLGVVGLATGAAVWAREREAPNSAMCRAREAELASIWNANVTGRTERAFQGTKSPLSDGTWRKAKSVIDEYVETWRGAHRRICETRASEPAMRIMLEQKTSCLSERLELVRAVTTSLEHVDAPMLEQVPVMLQLLPRVNACEDAGEVAQRAPLPAPEKLAAVDAARKKIASAATTIAAGRYADGLKQADEAWQSANAVGYLPILSEAYLWVGTAQGRLGHVVESEQALDQAVSAASAGHAPMLAVRAWIQLMHFVGFEGKRYDDGFRWAEYARSELDSMPQAFELEAERLSWMRAMLLDRKRYDDALVVSRKELALVELRFGVSHRLYGAALDGLAGALAGKCRSRDAIEPQEKACAILEKEYGSPHPQLALCLGNLAALHGNLGDHAVALSIKQQALAMFERVPGHPNHVAMAQRNLVRSLLELGRINEARVALTAASALSLRDSDETRIILLRGELDRRDGNLDDAVTKHTKAVARTQNDEASRRLEPLVALAESNLAAKRWTAAATTAEEAVTLALGVHGEGSCRLADPLRVRADALIGQGHASEALPLLERARGLTEGAQIDPLVRGRIDLALARSQAGGDSAPGKLRE